MIFRRRWAVVSHRGHRYTVHRFWLFSNALRFFLASVEYRAGDEIYIWDRKSCAMTKRWTLHHHKRMKRRQKHGANHSIGSLDFTFFDSSTFSDGTPRISVSWSMAS